MDGIETGDLITFIGAGLAVEYGVVTDDASRAPMMWSQWSSDLVRIRALRDGRVFWTSRSGLGLAIKRFDLWEVAILERVGEP